jgi:hypothetical protein
MQCIGMIRFNSQNLPVQPRGFLQATGLVMLQRTVQRVAYAQRCGAGRNIGGG